VNHYNGFTYNCADFARDIVNMYFPGAARADHINDFGMTGPKAIAKSFVHYAAKHPELEFHVIRFSQIPGEYAASKDNRKGTEELFRSKRWCLPLAVLTPYELILFAGSYMITGRFNPELELRRRPADEVVGLEKQMREARAQGDWQKEIESKQKIKSVRANALGTPEEWSGYDASVRQYEAEAIEQGDVSDSDSLRSFAHQTVSKSWITMDDQGGLWLRARDGQSHPAVGLSANTLTDVSSNPKFSYLLALSRVDTELQKAPKNRETLAFFRKDWELLERLRVRVVPAAAGTTRTEAGGGAAQ
jgi:hypothetical protein